MVTSKASSDPNSRRGESFVTSNIASDDDKTRTTSLADESLRSEVTSFNDIDDQLHEDDHLDEVEAAFELGRDAHFHEPIFTPDYSHRTDPFASKHVPAGAGPAASIAPVDDATKPGAREQFARLHKFSLYETNTKYYLVGGDITDQQFRMLKIDRLAPPGQLHITEDDYVYDKREMTQLLNTIEDGNRSAGGMKHKCKGWGLLGFIRFTDAFYMLIVTKKEQVATIGGHFIYQVDSTEMVPLTTGNASRWQSNKSIEESRFLAILANLDLHRSFYFSYSYNITRTLQHNVIRAREELLNPGQASDPHDFNDMLLWNHHLLSPALEVLKHPYDWCLPIIHGFVDQSCVNVYGRAVYITLIARRSRFFAGARFLKRGSNDLGYVANDVETEQIVSDKLVTSFHSPGLRAFQSPNYTSFVQHRGSIPLYWTQENTGVTPKPAIDLNLLDPFYAAAALHFDNLFERYSTPIYVLNLVKARERVPRESKLLVEYQNAIKYLNQALPEANRIRYCAYDMSRASKTRGQDVIGSLSKIARDIVDTTGFFRNGDDRSTPSSVQNGVARSNCIDCLDRTNAAQFIIGKEALAQQLQALGVIPKNDLQYDCDTVNLFAHMFNDHGDTLASQYGGSHLVNTMETYRKISNWSSHSRDMLESFKRFYHNSFLDTQRQEAYNLFLGNYIYASGQPMLWELPTDYYLHHANPKAWPELSRRSYIEWFTPEFLQPRKMPPLYALNEKSIVRLKRAQKQWWNEYYRPRVISSFLKVYAYRMNSTLRYLPAKSLADCVDLSPFSVRKSHDMDPEKKYPKRETVDDSPSEASPPRTPSQSGGSFRWLRGRRDEEIKPPPGRLEEDRSSQFARALTSSNLLAAAAAPLPSSAQTWDKATKNQWTLAQFYNRSLNPAVTEHETNEYERYVSHPQHLPLVIHDDSPTEIDQNFVDYLSRNGVHASGLVQQPGADNDDPQDFRHPHASHLPALSTELAALNEYLKVPSNPLLVTDEDKDKKRYQAYRKWLRGKSLFKQSKHDPEYRAAEGRGAYLLRVGV